MLDPQELTSRPLFNPTFITLLKMYRQQKDMFMSGIRQCNNRIISIFQPHVCPIVHGKAKVEFGRKIGTSIVNGYTFIDYHSWESYNLCSI